MKKIAILMGGPSNEFDISLLSGQNVIGSLSKEKYQPIPIIVDKQETWHLYSDQLRLNIDYDKPNSLVDLYHSGQINDYLKQAIAAHEAMGKLKQLKIQYAFIAMHGRYGEDGRIQGFLEVNKMAHNGSNSKASAICIHKAAAKRICASAGITVAEDMLVIAENYMLDKENVLKKCLGFGKPIVIKAVASGSSLDMTILDDPNKAELDANISALLKKAPVLIEKYIHGRELTCGILEERIENKISAKPLAVTEIKPKTGAFFSYDAKYSPDSVEETTPAPLSAKQTETVQQAALLCHQILGCRGYSRSDFILSHDAKTKNEPQLYYLETNTLPGLTNTSLLPQGAAASGIAFKDLLDRIIEL